jgi:segregation and condensation protein B
MTTSDIIEEPLSPAALVESLLFSASEPVPVTIIASALDISPDQVETALAALAEDYRRRGLKILRMGDRVHLTTSPRAAREVEKFLGLEHTVGLSRAALETLSILAYQQPLTRPQVDAIRGVNSESVIENLMAKGLVEEVGRTDGPGLPPLQLDEPAAEGQAADGNVPPAHILKE